jgi:hypothetical protein
MQRNRTNWKLLAWGVGVGLIYGLGVRAGIHYNFPSERYLQVMSASFLLVLPFCMGFLAAFIIERKQPQSPGMWLLLGVLPVAGGLLGSALTMLEGWICVLMFAPIGVLCGALGGLCGGFGGWLTKNRSLTCIVFLPFMIGPLEHTALWQYEERTVHTSIDIHASPAVVWTNIKTVPRISSTELTTTWTTKVGFPRPIEATLSHEGIGGVRHARFDGGVLFVETIDDWEPGKRLAFYIKAQTAEIPSTTLDSHVTVGGPFFDTLRGEYRIETLSNGFVRLHLSSRHRLSTDFNWYAHYWTDAVMADIQNSILRVLRERCERQQIQTVAE